MAQTVWAVAKLASTQVCEMPRLEQNSFDVVSVSVQSYRVPSRLAFPDVHP